MHMYYMNHLNIFIFDKKKKNKKTGNETLEQNKALFYKRRKPPNITVA